MYLVTDSKRYSETAIAAYAINLVAGSVNNGNYVTAGMAAFQAEHFNSDWTVIEQGSSFTGFSAVLLQNHDGEKVLAIAGTDTHSVLDFVADAYIFTFGTALGMPQYASLEGFYGRLISEGKLGANEPITVTGHSLGGFLAQAFTLRHSNVVSAAYTYNSPGFREVGKMLEFAGSPDPVGAIGKITNVVAMDGLSATTILGTQFGSSHPIRIEQDPIHGTDNHSIVRLTDALAVQSTLALLDPKAGATTLNVLVQGASNKGDNTLEVLTDSLRRMILGPALTPTTVEDRDALYSNLQALTVSTAFQTLAGKVVLNSAAAVNLADTARTDFGAFASLLALSPVVLSGTDAANSSLLATVVQGAWGTTYSDWQADKLAVAAGRPATTYTDTYLNDRQAMLQWVMVQNLKDDDASAVILGQPGSSRFTDKTTGRTVVLGEALENQRQQIIFGRSGIDDLAGFGKNDHLYGGAGNDTLSGQSGDDYLEGNADDDTLIGGAGADTLLGGTGFDTYEFESGFGNDTVIDAGGQGKLTFEGNPIAGGKKVPGLSNVWEDEARQYVYTLVTGTTGGNDLVIGRRQTAGASMIDGTITVRGWQPGQLGIQLDDAAQPSAAPARTINGGFIKKVAQDGKTYVFSDGNYVADGVDLSAADLLFSDERADRLVGGAGNDGLAGNAGDDELDGGDGDDVILGGSGSDRITGGAGNDYIAGSGSYAGFQALPKTPLGNHFRTFNSGSPR